MLAIHGPDTIPKLPAAVLVHSVIAEQQQAQFPAAMVPRKMHLDRCERLAAVSLLHTDVDVVLGRR